MRLGPNRKIALIATAKEYDLVGLYAEAAWSQVLNFARAAFDIEHLAAAIAVKMVMVSQSGTFVASGLAGDIDGLKLAIF